MLYLSTRGNVSGLKFKDTVMMGMADDGGLLLPAEYPQIDCDALKGATYADTAYMILKHFADDIPDNKLKLLINKSYAIFDDATVIPLVKTDECYFAELFHGPTYAFKDVALQLLGNLFEYILAERNEKLNIIGATSGDTGSAAIAGVRGKQNINITILYPDGRVSPVQERQMATVADSNVHTFAVDGTFDDCQDMVKALFADVAFKQENHLGAVNSINWARIVAQIVYYFYAYSQMPIPSGSKVNFVVPTGNFGNIFAGYCAKRMGLPIAKLVVATNENDILHRFIEMGDYSVTNVKPTHSPSMDIQISSNLERYLYYICDNSSALVSAMQQLKANKSIKFSNSAMEKVRQDFTSFASSNTATEQAIARIYKNNNYIIDPHTACGSEAAYQLKLNPERTIVLATAHPAKFGDVITKVLGFAPTAPIGIRMLEKLPLKRMQAPADVDNFKSIISKFA